MSNFLIALSVFLITVIGALFAVPYMVDWNGYRGVFEDEASRMLGREVRIGGSVNLHFLPAPYFSLEKVRIADTSGTLQEPFFRTESVTIKLAIPPLLRGAIEANEIELKKPVLRLAIAKDDTWNWQSFAASWSQAAYLPSNVVLSSVTISQGLIVLHGPDGEERTRFEGIGAELSSPALDGPYRLRATFGKAGAERDLRLTTAKPAADGSFKFKGSLRASDTAASYLLDARVVDFTGRMRVEGELTAKLPFAGLWPSTGRAITDDAFELKSGLKADAAQLELANLTLSFERDGQPQIVSGDLVAQWRQALAVETKLTSRWLDLDRIAGVGAKGGPLDSAMPFAQRIRELLPAGGRSRASIAIEQANVGREAVSALLLTMVRTGDTLEIEELKAGMPGGSRGELQGVLGGSADAPVFTGSVALRGSSLTRFTNWASAGALSAEGQGDGTYGLRAHLSIEPQRVALESLAGELSGTSLRGAASYRWGATQELGLQFDGPQLDARAFIPAGAGLGDIVALLTRRAGPEEGAGKGNTAAGPTGGPGALDLSLRINTGQLLTAGAVYRDVAVEIERKAGTLRIPVLRLSGDDGFVLDLEGEVGDTGSKPKGSLRMAASAETAAALRPLAELVGIPPSLHPDAARLQGLAPFRIAGTMAFGTRLPTSIDIAAEGEAGGGGVRIRGALDGGAGGWRSGLADLTLSMENPDARAIAALVLPATGSVATAGTPVRGDGAPAGRILLRAGGIPNDGMATLFTLSAGDTAIAFRGRLSMKADATRLSGDLELTGADGSRVAALAGLTPPLRLGEFPLGGTVRFATDGRVIDVERFSFAIGGTNLRGRLILSPEGTRRRIEGQVETEAVSVADLFAPLLDRRLGSATAAAEALLADRPSIWPDQPFEPGVFDAFAGTITLKARRIDLFGSAGLDNALLQIVLGEGRVTVRQQEGQGLKSAWSTALAIGRVPAGGAELAGTLQAQGIDLASALPGTRGTAAVKLAFNGRGTSPRALVAAMQGQGTLDLQAAAVPGISPKAVGLAVDASLKASNESAPQVLRKTLAGNLSTTLLPLPQSVALEIVEGQLRSKPVSVATQVGTASGTVLLDLGSLALMSDWKLADTALAPADRALPAIAVQYRGPLAALGRLEPEVSLEALEREVTVRRMERDVDELERLRRLDEARRREDAERIREQLERTPAPVPAPPPPPQAAPPRPPPPAAPKSTLKSLFPW